MAEENEYLVRGALLYCINGTHPRRINLPICHGSYIKGHPLLHKNDCKMGENISYFGVCESETPPEGAEEIRLAGYVPEGRTEEVEDVQGLKCIPDILGEWRGVKTKTNIIGDFPELTMESYLICNCGGIIQPVTSGQEYEE